jgi:hypothetical protein
MAYSPDPIYQVELCAVFSIQNKWDISFAFGINQLIKYKINTSKWLLNLTDRELGNHRELLEVSGASLFKQEPSSKEQKGVPTK